jgi:hypothetical protein
MNNALHQTNWLPGLIVLGTALIAALLFVLNARRKHRPVPSPSSLEDLETRYQSVIAQLKEHAANKHSYPGQAWADEHTRLEQLAAAVLRERAGVAHEGLKAQARAEKKAAAQAQATGFFAKNPAMKGALWGAGVVLFFVLLGVLLSRESVDRVEGRQITGMPAGPGEAPMQTPPPAKEDVELKTALGRAERSPDDIEALSTAAKVLIARQMFDEADPLIRRATAIDPFHVQTRIHRAVIQAVDGQTPAALNELKHLADTFEDAYEARLFAGMLALQAEDKDTALAQFERYVVEAPAAEQPPMLKMGIAQLKQEIASGRPPAKQP